VVLVHDEQILILLVEEEQKQMVILELEDVL
jgi:hypothetical protein